MFVCVQLYCFSRKKLWVLKETIVLLHGNFIFFFSHVMSTFWVINGDAQPLKLSSNSWFNSEHIGGQAQMSTSLRRRNLAKHFVEVESYVVYSVNVNIL